MLLEIALGDAYGAGFEYTSDSFVRKNNSLTDYVSHPRHHDLIPGTYTDDTQMSIAIAELLLENKEWTHQNIAHKFVEVFKRDPRKGYSQRFYHFLQGVYSGEEFLARIHADSDKSGAAMRSGPLGFLPTIDQILSYARIQAEVTHNTAGGIASACAAALMSYYFITNQGSKKNLGEFIGDYVPTNWKIPWKGSVGSKGKMSVAAAITAIQTEDSLSSILQRCVALGGDTDTVASIAMAAASCSLEINADLPLSLIKNVENGSYGRDYLIQLDQKLKLWKEASL